MRKAKNVKRSHLGQSGSCVGCLRGTDTGLAFAGSVEWQAAGLTILGIPTDQAVRMVEQTPLGLEVLQVRVCSSCVEDSPLARYGVAPVLLTADADIPCLQEPVR